MHLPIRSRRSAAAPLALLAVLAGLCPPASGQQSEFTNPVLRGGFPDPSICRVGEDFYMVNSSFEYFPGLPIHHSRDLVNWALVGYGLHREDQVSGAVNLVDVQSNGGIHAPTLRCRDGRYYLITTNVYTPPGEDRATEFVNFVLTADDIKGPWSNPQVIEGAPGIDPDLYFDDDGRVWYAGTHSPDNPAFPGEGEIWLQEIDPATWQLVGERHFLWRGACGGVWAEGPHLYKRDGRYYLMIAEGGTSLNHAVTVAVSDSITGPYHSNPRNPILTSRHLGADHWVNSTGHADLIELADGRWFMVALGIRADEGLSSNMGRETFLVPMIWEREPFEWKDPRYLWPVAAPHSGRVARRMPLPFATRRQYRSNEFVDEFDGPDLNLAWNFRRVPKAGTYSLSARPGHLRLYAHPEILRQRGQASLIGVRQVESDFEYAASMRFEPGVDGVEAGISVFQKDDRYLNFTVRNDGGAVAALTIGRPGETSRAERQAIDDYDGEIVLRVVSRGVRYAFAYSIDEGRNFVTIASTTAEHLLAHDSYTGAYLGLYSTGNGVATGGYADFDRVRIEVHERDTR